MDASPERSVSIVEKGRTGSVVYREKAGSLSFYWEFGGGEVVAIIQLENIPAWKAGYSWIGERRAEILRYVASEVIRQKAPDCIAQIEEEGGCIQLKQATSAPMQLKPPAPKEFSMRTYRSLRMKLGLAVLILAGIFAGTMWFKNKVLVIDPGKGAPIGLSVRTDKHIATLIQTLEPYTPSLNRNHRNDTYRFSIFLVPLDGSGTKPIHIGGGFPSNAMSLAKILGSDGSTLWFDVLGIGGVDLKSYELREPGEVRDPFVPEPTSPFAPSVGEYLSAGLLTAPGTWLGLHSPAELESEFAVKKFVRRVVRQEEAKQMRRFHRGVLDAPVDDKYHRILSMTPMGDNEYLNAAFLRMDDASEPLRTTDPDGALMIFTSEPGLNGRLMVARVDTHGNIIWQVDTGIDRFKLSQIMPGTNSFAFVGTRPMVPDKVSEPLLVIVDNSTGKMIAHSHWQ